MSAPGASIRGLPGPLPKGERLLWQGAPTAGGAAWRVFHLPLAALWIAGVATALATHAGGTQEALIAAAPSLVLGGLALCLLALFGWLVHRTTTYTITDRRVVMQVGMAIPVTFNLPFGQIEEAGLHGFADGSGDIPLRLRRGERVAYLHLWPHARPWCLTEPQPMLRSVPQAAEVAAILAQALAAHAGQPIPAARPVPVETSGGLAPVGARQAIAR